MAQSEPTLPDQSRPWYYHGWFLIPVFILGWPINFPFVLWPVWGVLILRSPWHNQPLVRGLAWSMLIVGTVLSIMNLGGPRGPGYAIAIIVPGFLVTLVTQVMWTRYRLEHRLGESPPAPPVISTGDSPSPPRRSAPRGRANRRRSSRSGRAPPY